MREFYEIINEYPWTTVLLFFGLVVILGEITSIIGALFHRE